MTFQEFIDKYLGQKKGYPDGSYVGQCLSICKLYIKECFGINPPPSGTNSAYGYWSNFPSPLGTVLEKVLNTPDLIPQEGWIAIWKPWSSNQWGHIAIVAKGCTTGTLKNWAQNWTSKKFQLESNRYTNVIGFLKPIEENNMTKDETNALNIIKGYRAILDEGNLEGTAAKAVGDSKDLETKKKDLSNCKSELKTSKENHLKFILSLAKELKVDLDKQFVAMTAKEKEDKILELLVAEIDEKNDYIRRYKVSQSKNADKLNSYEVFKLFIQKLFPPWKK